MLFTFYNSVEVLLKFSEFPFLLNQKSFPSILILDKPSWFTTTYLLQISPPLASMIHFHAPFHIGHAQKKSFLNLFSPVPIAPPNAQPDINMFLSPLIWDHKNILFAHLNYSILFV